MEIFQIKYLYSKHEYSLKLNRLHTFPFLPKLNPEIIQHKVHQREKPFVFNDAPGEHNLFPRVLIKDRVINKVNELAKETVGEKPERRNNS